MSDRRTRRPFVLAAVMLAMFMGAVEATIVATAVPTIVAELGGFRLFSWVFSAFLICQAVTTPLYGKLSDLYGRKPVFYVGTAIFLAGSTLAGLSHTMIQLIAWRAVQGVGGGAVLPVATTIVGDIYTARERARIQGWLSSVWGISSIVGPVLGAFFVERLTWSLVFWVNLPIGLASMGLLAMFLHEGVERRRHRIDGLGALLLMAGTAVLMFALIQGAELSAPLLGGSIALSAVFMGGFIRHEQRAVEPMMPLELWRDRTIAIGNLGGWITGMLLMGVMSFLPTYVQGVMGTSPTIAGFTLAAMSVGWPLAATTSGYLMVRTTYRATAVMGGVGLLVGAGLLLALEPERGPAFAGLASFVVGVGMGLSTTVFLVSIQAAVPWSRRGVATSSNMFMRIVGQAMGAATFGAVLNARLRRAIPGEADVVGQLVKPLARAALGADRLASLERALADAMHDLYMLAVVLAVATLLLALGLPAGQSAGRQAAPEGG